MKKIVSMLAMAALTLGAVSAADISMEYATKGSIFTEKSTTAAGSTTSIVAADGKAFLDQSGYGDSASDFILSSSGTAGGVLLDVDVNARDKSIKFDQVYGWMNFGSIQLTTGKWEGRYVNRVKEDAGKWDSSDFEKFKPGIVLGDDGKSAQSENAYDVDNLTAVKGTNQISTALAFTSRPDDSTYFMVKGVIVTNNWGGTGRWGSGTYKDGEYDFNFESGFAGEIAFRKDDIIDINILAKSLVRDELVVAAFVRPLILNPVNLMVGFTCAGNLTDNGDDVERNGYKWGVDLRARIPLSDAIAITTMNNLSSDVADKQNHGKDSYQMSMWNMISVAYKVSDAMKVQLTGESYMSNFRTVVADTAASRNTLGGAKLSVLAGMVYNFNPDASFSAGIKYEKDGVFATSDWTNANATTATFSIPFVFSVAL